MRPTWFSVRCEPRWICSYRLRGRTFLRVETPFYPSLPAVTAAARRSEDDRSLPRDQRRRVSGAPRDGGFRTRWRVNPSAARSSTPVHRRVLAAHRRLATPRRFAILAAQARTVARDDRAASRVFAPAAAASRRRERKYPSWLRCCDRVLSRLATSRRGDARIPARDTCSRGSLSRICWKKNYMLVLLQRQRTIRRSQRVARYEYNYVFLIVPIRFRLAKPDLLLRSPRGSGLRRFETFPVL